MSDHTAKLYATPEDDGLPIPMTLEQAVRLIEQDRQQINAGKYMANYSHAAAMILTAYESLKPIRPSSPPLGVSETMLALIRVYAKDLTHSPGSPAHTASLDALLTAIAALEAQVPQWQPIETAPRDVNVLVYSTGTFYVAHFNTFFNRWRNIDGPSFPLATPTHWMPLPPAPTGP